MVRRRRSHRRGPRVLPAVLQLIDEFGAEFATDAPSQTTAASMIGRKDDGELSGDFDVFRDRLYPTDRNVGDGAVTRQQAGTDLDLGAPRAQLTFASPPICKHCALSPCETADPSVTGMDSAETLVSP